MPETLSLPDLDALDPAVLKALLLAHHERYTARLSSSAIEIERLVLLVEKLRRMLFGAKSEKVVRQIEQLELQLEELQAASAIEETKAAVEADRRIVQAPAPSRPIDRGLAGPGLLAHVLVSKYADHLPLYRQSEIYSRESVDPGRSTLAG